MPQETVITADLDLRLARDKIIEPQHGGYNVALFDDRRPELYSRLVQSDS